MKYYYVPFIAALAFSAAGCATDISGGTAVPDNREKISGFVKRTDGNLLEVGAILEVAIEDVSRVDAPSRTLKKDFWPVSGRDMELPFTLSVSKQDMEDCRSMRYRCSFSASIKEGDKLLYVNDTVHDFPSDDGKYVIKVKKVHESPVGF